MVNDRLSAVAERASAHQEHVCWLQKQQAELNDRRSRTTASKEKEDFPVGSVSKDVSHSFQNSDAIADTDWLAAARPPMLSRQHAFNNTHISLFVDDQS